MNETKEVLVHELKLRTKEIEGYTWVNAQDIVVAHKAIITIPNINHYQVFDKIFEAVEVAKKKAENG